MAAGEHREFEALIMATAKTWQKIKDDANGKEDPVQEILRMILQS